MTKAWKNKFSIVALGWLVLAVPQGAMAGVTEVISRALQLKLGAERVEVTAITGVIPAQPLSQASSAVVLEENARGEARLLVRGNRQDSKLEEQAEYRVKFAAWVRGWVAVRRIAPGEALGREKLQLQEINVAEGLAHEYRGALLAQTEDPSRLEARQTLLPGSFVAASAAKRIPDLRRGDTVQLELVSGGVSLTTSGLALEPSSFDQKIRVQALKSKREFVGVLREGPRVEVTL